ncbi:uncharacterized protein BT62DRAFT_981780 [Guyanagaster necrorhizus]|uniref:Geranylgeranyl pyrophosphate synthetase n=1 Tax=Guyanagaster necrorhizus TaxID=856835 RepID=A0A9P7VNU2_9AGAR|nr:uncharacterized protein BT62DRAFT_981780 [Guyanagaster necrorhizus MCA 3950]KAG7444159.1 hypothetical protein BT62DRAFT_981780 [Guyanagaster necrorhizus MCA 3950]
MSSNPPDSAPSAPLPPDKDIFEGLDTKCIDMLTIPTLNISDTVVGIKDVEYIGSYNWIKNSESESDPSPAIVVPVSLTISIIGSPPEWQNKAVPYRIPADRGFFFSDQNGFQMPSAILLPLMVAVETVAEDKKELPFDWSSADFVTDRNCLRKLLRWIGGGNNERSMKEFRIDMQLAGKKTVLLNRWDKRYKEQASGYSYGYGFEDHTTSPAIGCESSSGHHRIITYDLGGFKMVVRFEVDACISVKPGARAPVTSSSSSSATVDELSNLLSAVNIGPPTTSIIPVTPSRSLTVKSGGSYVPQNAIVELTTVSERRRPQFDWYEQYPQLFLSQTSLHFLGIHDRGYFHAVEKNELNALSQQARIVQPSLKKLVKVLKIIQELVVKNGMTSRLTLIRDGERLKVYERRSEESCLPKRYLVKFEAKK